jgi:hypothetical protein
MKAEATNEGGSREYCSTLVASGFSRKIGAAIPNQLIHTTRVSLCLDVPRVSLM